jgi:hypothetical protein
MVTVRERNEVFKARRRAKANAGRPGDEILDEVAEFAETLLYVQPWQMTAIVLGCAASYIPEASSTLPYFLVTAHEEQAGKTTVLDTAMMLSDGGWMSDSTWPGIKAFYNRKGHHTLGLDEIGKIYGENGDMGKTNPLYKFQCESYRRNATLSYSVSRTLYEASSYGVQWMSGLHTSVPGDILSRCIPIRMSPKPKHIHKDDTADEDVEAMGHAYQDTLRDWLTGHMQEIKEHNKNEVRKLHPALSSRKKQTWGLMFSTAWAAGGRWPALIMDAFLRLAMNESTEIKPTPNQQMLLDVATILRRYEAEVIFNVDLVDELQEMEDRPYISSSSNYLLATAVRAIGPSATISGQNLAGDYGAGRGRVAAPILARADALSARLRTTEAAAADEPDEPDAELEFEVV